MIERFHVDVSGMNKKLEKCIPTTKEIQKLLDDLGEEFILKFIGNIEDQKTWLGKRIDENEPTWTAKKLEEGWSLASLIAKDYDFVEANNWTVKVSRNSVTIKMNKELADKYDDVFGVAEDLKKNYMEVMPDPKIKEEFKWFKDRVIEEFRKLVYAKIKLL